MAPRAVRRRGDDDLPDPLEPANRLERPDDPPAPPLPKGDVRVASWIALSSAGIVLVWYFSILVVGGVTLGSFSATAQFIVWGLALVSFACGIVSLNARRNREFAAAGFIAGVVALLVSLTIGLPTGFQVLF